jgi:hypothetical protein
MPLKNALTLGLSCYFPARKSCRFAGPGSVKQTSVGANCEQPASPGRSSRAITAKRIGVDKSSLFVNAVDKTAFQLVDTFFSSGRNRRT